jgi:hypothetical protein
LSQIIKPVQALRRSHQQHQHRNHLLSHIALLTVEAFLQHLQTLIWVHLSRFHFLSETVTYSLVGIQHQPVEHCWDSMVLVTLHHLISLSLHSGQVLHIQLLITQMVAHRRCPQMVHTQMAEAHTQSRQHLVE